MRRLSRDCPLDLGFTQFLPTRAWNLEYFDNNSTQNTKSRHRNHIPHHHDRKGMCLRLPLEAVQWLARDSEYSLYTSVGTVSTAKRWLYACWHSYWCKFWRRAWNWGTIFQPISLRLARRCSLLSPGPDGHNHTININININHQTLIREVDQVVEERMKKLPRGNAY